MLWTENTCGKNLMVIIITSAGIVFLKNEKKSSRVVEYYLSLRPDIIMSYPKRPQGGPMQRRASRKYFCNSRRTAKTATAVAGKFDLPLAISIIFSARRLNFG